MFANPNRVVFFYKCIWLQTGKHNLSSQNDAFTATNTFSVWRKPASSELCNINNLSENMKGLMDVHFCERWGSDTAIWLQTGSAVL